MTSVTTVIGDMSAFPEAKKKKTSACLRDMAEAKCSNPPPEACIARYHIFNDVSSSLGLLRSDCTVEFRARNSP